MNKMKTQAINTIIRATRKLFYNTPVMRWKLTGIVYDKVFSLGAPDFTKPIVFRSAQFYVDPTDRSYLPTMAAGYYEEKELDIFEQLSKSSHVFLDIGANIGMYSVLGAIKNPELKSYAFEPVKENYELLEKNIKINHLKNSVEVIRKAVSNKNGTASIYLSDASSGMHSLTVHHKGVSRKISTVTIDTFCKDYGVKPDLIKVDVEGHEPSAFAGMIETLRKNDATILMEFLAGVNEEMESLMEIFAKKYKHCYIVDEIKGTLTRANMSDLKLNKNYNIILSKTNAHKKIIESFLT